MGLTVGKPNRLALIVIKQMVFLLSLGVVILNILRKPRDYRGF